MRGPIPRNRNAGNHGAGTLLLAVVVVSLIGCATTPPGLCPAPPGSEARTIYLVAHAWHAGIVVRQQDIAPGLWPESRAFAGKRFIEVGWGDRDFYMSPKPGVGLALKAALWPTQSVLHIAAFDEAPADYFPGSRIVAIALTPEALERVVRYVQSSYARDEHGEPVRLRSGLYGEASAFYLSRETYHLFNTCNVWTARALKDAGCPVTPFATLTVDALFDQAERFGQALATGK